MAVNERKKRIMEHLTLTGNLNFKRRSPDLKLEASATPTTPPITPIKPDSRKKRIKEHLARSSANFNCFSLSSQERKQQVQEHVLLSKG